MSDWWRDWWTGFGAGRRRQLIGTVVAAALLLLFATLAAELLEQELAVFDTTVIGWVRSVQSPGMTAFMRAVTALGSPVVLTLFALIGVAVLYRRGHRQATLALLGSLIGGWLWDELFKRLFHRLRPPGPWLAPASGYSFPSGHSVVAVAFYGVLAYYLIRLPMRSAWRLATIGLSLLVIALIGISRIYLGVHYPSDVVAGFAFGGAWASFCVLQCDRTGRRRPSYS